MKIKPIVHTFLPAVFGVCCSLYHLHRWCYCLWGNTPLLCCVGFSLITYTLLIFSLSCWCISRCFQPSCCQSPFTTWVINKDILPVSYIMPKWYPFRVSLNFSFPLIYIGFWNHDIRCVETSNRKENLAWKLSSVLSFRDLLNFITSHLLVLISLSLSLSLSLPLSLSLLAFVCHHNTYLIYDSLKQRSHTRFTTVSHVSVSISFVFCLILGLAGFVTFMDETQGQ